MRHSVFATSETIATAWRKSGAVALLIAAAGLLSACETDGSAPGPFAALTQPAKPPEAQGPQQPPMTRSRAAMECWMKTEKGRADENLDKRADVVTKCIDEKLKVAKPAAPKT